MAILAINTSGQFSDIAVSNGKRTSERAFGNLREQDVELPGLVRAICDLAGTNLKSIKTIGVVIGPGSFTGVRIGLSFAKGLGLALKVPVLGVTTLEATVPKFSDNKFLVALSAKRRPPEKTWWAQLVSGDRNLSDAFEYDVVSIENLAKSHGATILSDTPDCFKSASPPLTPRARNVLRIVEKADSNARPAVALYVRKPDAVPRITTF